MNDFDKNNGGWTEWSNYVLKKLESFEQYYESLSEEVSDLSHEFTQFSGIKHAIGDFKEWKNSIDESLSLDDLKSIKQFYINNKDFKDIIAPLKKEIKEELKKQSEILEDYKKFKVKVYTIAGVVSFLFATALTIVGFFF